MFLGGSAEARDYEWDGDTVDTWNLSEYYFSYLYLEASQRPAQATYVLDGVKLLKALEDYPEGPRLRSRVF